LAIDYSKTTPSLGSIKADRAGSNPPKVIELVEARNKAARRMGYHDFYAMSRALDLPVPDAPVRPGLHNSLAQKRPGNSWNAATHRGAGLS